MNPLKLLIIEDSEDDLALLLRHLERAGYDPEFEQVQTSETMKSALTAKDWDIIISEFQMRDFNAMEAHRILKASSLDLPFIIISGTIGEETAVQAMVAGVNDYLMKDNLARLAPAIERELQEAANRRARREAENALQESEESYRELFENANDTIYTTDLNGNYTSVNKKGEELTGYTRAEILQTNFSDLLSGEDIRKVKRMIAQKLSGKAETTRYELTILTKDNVRKHVEISSRVIGENGRPIGIQGIARDVTERKRAEQKLRESEENFRALVEATTQHVWTLNVADPSTGFIDWWINLTGQTAAEAQNLGWLDAIHPEDREETEAAWRQAFETYTLFDKIYRLRLANGEYHYYAVRGVPVFDEEKHFRQWIGTFTDITERKRVEEKLRESESRLQLSQQAARVGTWELNLETNQTIWSDGIWALIDLKPGEIELNYDNWIKFVNPDDVKMMEAALQKSITDDEIFDTEFRITTAGGQNLWLASKGRVIRGKEGKPERILGVNIDITARKHIEEDLHKSEEKLRQAQKLESVGRLAGGIAHDFNNMLTAINGYSELALRRLAPDDSIRGFIEEIKKAGERSATLTQQLLAFSRRQILQPKNLNINRIISETTVLLQRIIGENIKLISVLNPETGQIEADPGQISQVIMNLAVNSRDSMPQGGTITIKTDNVDLGEEEFARANEIIPGRYVYLTVSDTGSGIDEEVMDSIFEPFYTTKEVGKGTGLGLATVYGIIKQSGGYIYVRTKIGQGTTFDIYLPRVKEAALQDKNDSLPETVLRGTETILVVEDEDIVRKLTRQILESCGYKIIEASDGEKALKIFKKSGETIDLLLTDMVLPKMGGHELAGELLKTYPGLKILFTSGYTEVWRGVTSFEVRKNFIHKPFEPDALALKVREILDAGKQH